MSLSIGGYNTFYPVYNTYPVSPVRGADAVTRGSEGTAGIGSAKNEECQTCKERKYVDGSNDPHVSFKTPGHIDPSDSAAKVMAHEKEHVAAAIAEGSKPGKELISSTVTLKTSICPECGTAYVSGGVTHTTMRTTQEVSNPYVKLQRDMNRNLLAGMNFDMSA